MVIYFTPALGFIKMHFLQGEWKQEEFEWIPKFMKMAIRFPTLFYSHYAAFLQTIQI